MAISRVEIKDFLVFKGEFALDFCPGVNVLIGGNATGKTTLMKVLYWACEFDQGRKRYNFPVRSGDIDKTIGPPIDDYFYEYSHEGVSIFHFFAENPIVGQTSVLNCSISETSDKDITNYEWGNDEWSHLTFPTVFIPVTEMLSHRQGLLELSRTRDIPFDAIELDILARAGEPETREITPNVAKVLEKLADVIEGTVSFDGQDFYIDKKNLDKKIPFSLEASGYRKLGLLWKLLRNGLLEKGSILFWDEPENSLNPEHISMLVDVLLELSRNDVQIFLATHSEIFASYLAVNRNKGDSVKFISLYKDGEGIKADTDSRFDLLEPNNLIEEPVKLYKKEIERGLGGNG